MPNASGRQPVLHKKHVARLERERQQSRIILYTFIGILVAVVLLLGYGYLDMNYFQLRRPVAKVGETEILAGDFEARVRLQRQQLLGQYSMYKQYEQFGMDVSSQLQQVQGMLDSSESLGQSVLDQMVNEEIIRQESAKRGITASQAEIDEMKQSVFSFYPNGTPTPTVTPTQFNTPEIPAEAFTVVTITPTASPTSEFTATPEATATAFIDATTTGTLQATATLIPSPTLTATLEPTATATEGPTSTPEPTATPYTRAAFDKDYQDAIKRMTNLGFSEDIYNSLFEIQILEKKLKEVIAADVAPIEKQVWARHILVADEAAALAIIEKLKNGEDFATLAKELSTDTGSGANGGDLGWFGKGAMVPEFEAAAFALKKSGDYTTTPVKSQFGFHIIQLIAKQDRPLTAEQLTTARDKVFSDWIEKAKTDYGVETFDIWKEHVPTEPNFITMATEAANQQLTAVAEEKAAKKDATATPK
jgi:parvulin-like peptidyl-prolyl isomerase